MEVMPEWFIKAVKLEGIFMPSARSKRDELYNGASEAKFVHYTSAAAALNIIRKKSLWMRNTNCMSDYKEISHGREMLSNHFVNTPLLNSFFEVLNKYAPGVAKEAFELFNAWWVDTKSNTYIASISEHIDKEDKHGRLSMWRAFGGDSARVAIVLSIPWIPKGSLKLNLNFSPVIYHDAENIGYELEQVIKNIDLHGEFIKSVGKDEIKGYVFNMLMALVVCTKHEGFHEEKEWRAIYTPQKSPSELMKSEVIPVNGIPQTVFMLPLDVNVDKELEDLDFANLFDKLIIGPSQYSSALADAFYTELTKIGVQDAGKKINISGIPIRT